MSDATSGDSGETERDSGIGLKLFGFIAESVFAFIPEPCSESSRNAVRHHRGIAFILPRIPQRMTAHYQYHPEQRWKALPGNVAQEVAQNLAVWLMLIGTGGPG